jgi:hypothetical protein
LRNDPDAGGAAFPDPHEPQRVDPQAGKGVPLPGRNNAEVNLPAVFPAQFAEPDPCVDFVNNRMCTAGGHTAYPLMINCLSDAT